MLTESVFQFSIFALRERGPYRQGCLQGRFKVKPKHKQSRYKMQSTKMMNAKKSKQLQIKEKNNNPNMHGNFLWRNRCNKNRVMSMKAAITLSIKLKTQESRRHLNVVKTNKTRVLYQITLCWELTLRSKLYPGRQWPLSLKRVKIQILYPRHLRIEKP